MDPSTHTPLLEAIWAGDLTMVQALLEDQAHGCNFRVYPEDATHVLERVEPKPLKPKKPVVARRRPPIDDDGNDVDDPDIDTANDAVPITVDIVHERDLRYSRPPLTLAAQWSGPTGLQMLKLLIDARYYSMLLLLDIEPVPRDRGPMSLEFEMLPSHRQRGCDPCGLTRCVDATTRR